MSVDGFDGGMARADKWGCVSAAIVGVRVFAFLVLMDALGDCVRGTTCRHGFLLMVLTPTIIITAAVGLAVRLLVKSARKP